MDTAIRLSRIDIEVVWPRIGNIRAADADCVGRVDPPHTLNPATAKLSGLCLSDRIQEDQERRREEN